MESVSVLSFETAIAQALDARNLLKESIPTALLIMHVENHDDDQLLTFCVSAYRKYGFRIYVRQGAGFQTATSLSMPTSQTLEAYIGENAL